MLNTLLFHFYQITPALLERVIFGMDPFGSLGGCYDLQTASEVRSDPRFEISDLDYLHSLSLISLFILDIAYILQL